jgi:cytochrome b
MNDTLRPVAVWDAPTRWFHWINFVTILVLSFLGLVMLFKADLGITSMETRVALKEVHTITGYVFLLNLLWRMVWAFIGNRYARWNAILPTAGFMQAARAYVASIRSGHPQQYAGHNPLARLALTAILLLLLVLAGTGLIRAGTDILYPPFGSTAKEFLGNTTVDGAPLTPFNLDKADPEKKARFDAFRKPVGTIHLYAAWLLWLLIAIHVAAVVITDIREGGAIISAMFTGKKMLSGKAPDAD